MIDPVTFLRTCLDRAKPSFHTMDHTCPHCHASLQWKILKSAAQAGERRVLPLNAGTACPLCGGRIKRQQYPAEITYGLLGALLPAAGFAGYLFLHDSSKTWSSASLFAGILLSVLVNRAAAKKLDGLKKYAVDPSDSSTAG